MKSIIFIAPPAAGKGTQSSMVAKKYNIPHISTGDLLREAAKEKSERGEYIYNQMQTGGLVRDDVTIQLLMERLQKDDCNNGYILDGFPRNVEQAKIYDDILAKLNKDLGIVILLDLDYDTAMKRSVGRLNCPNCGRIYNSMYDNMKPQIEGICDSCHAVLSQRADDTYETFKKRYQTYLDSTIPLIDYYEEKGNLYHVDSSKDKDTVFKSIVEILEK